MNDLRTSVPIRAETEPAIQAELTRIRGMVRRLPESVRKQRLELLAPQIQTGEPSRYLKTQTALVAGEPLPVWPLADSAVRALAVIAEARLRLSRQ